MSHEKLLRLIDPAIDLLLLLRAARRLLGNVIEPSRFEQDMECDVTPRRKVTEQAAKAPSVTLTPTMRLRKHQSGLQFPTTNQIMLFLSSCHLPSPVVFFMSSLYVDNTL